MLKGLPLAYDRDMQEDKEPVFDAVDTLELVLPALAGMVSTMRVRSDRLAAAAPDGFTLATEIADWLVRRGIPFRSAHEIVGKLVALCAGRGCALDDVSDADLAAVSPHLTPEVRGVLTVAGALAARTTYGLDRTRSGRRPAGGRSRVGPGLARVVGRTGGAALTDAGMTAAACHRISPEPGRYRPALG